MAAGDKGDADSSSDAGFTVTAVTISMNTSTDIIAGKCRPNGTYSLNTRHVDFSDVATRTGTANASGDLAHDIFADMDLIPGDLVTLQCRNGTGDVSERRVVAP